MYVLHIPIIHAVIRVIVHFGKAPAPAVPLWQLDLFALTVGAVTYGAAWCSWQFYERRWLKLKVRFQMPRTA
jgi:peptidoglycan/LPS O-acetylase OafA/YrhL